MGQPLLNRFWIVLACVAIAVYHIWPPDEKITLGLDLKGGISYTLELDLSGVDSNHRATAVDKAMEILRKRVDPGGVREVIIQPSGENRVEVQVPGLKEEDAASTRGQLERVAYLELRLVHPRNEQELQKMRSQHSLPPPGYGLMTMAHKGKMGRSSSEEQLLVKIKPELTGKDLIKATAQQDPGGWQVNFELNSTGGEIFRKVTRVNIDNRLAIVLDKKLISAPSINSEIGSRGVITGDFDYREAVDLANSLENPLETPVKIVKVFSVDPSLGADSARSGFTSGIIALLLVILFMGIYYLRAGVIADVVLLLNVILLFGVLTIFKFTLTLPGIAGIILTVGIAVDANVLIYERIREELRKGKALLTAIDAGFDRAFGTIIDANVTTLITALVLAWLGSDPVQGFGVTLSAGIITSVFSAVFVSRLIFDIILRYTKLEKLTMLSMVRQTNVNFIGFKWPAIILSAAIILAGGIVAVKKGKEIYGVDFVGGDALTLKFSQRVDVSDLRKALDGAGLKEAFLQYQGEVQGGGEVLAVKVPFDQGMKAESALKIAFPTAAFAQLKMDKVGGTVGKELQWTALKGLLWASFFILIYITARFEFAYAVGAIVALLHDIFICLAFFFFTDRQLSLPAIGALLTIAGYSLNDTIVVYDRIREEFKLKGEKFGFVQLINLSVNETLSRTLLTSLTTLIASLALYFLGGGVINDFAFILVVGVITGTYSSVFIASPVLLLWHPSKLAPQEETRDGIGAQGQTG